MELHLNHLSKCYGTKQAVADVSLTLRPGIYGLLGPNGAGKTTLMRMISGVLSPASGTIDLNNKSITDLGEKYYTHLGYMPQDFGFYPDLSAREFLLYMSAAKGLPPKEAKKQTEKVLRLVNLQEAADQKVKTFSGGMKQRLGIAQAELNDPDLLIFDEPTAGLDPKERVRFRNLISDLAKDKIVIVSTHIVSDIAYIADTILMMKNGHLIFENPMETATDSLKGKVWEFSVSATEAADYTRRYLVANLHHEKDRIRLRILHDKAPTRHATAVNPSLEDLFLYYFGDEAGIAFEERSDQYHVALDSI